MPSAEISVIIPLYNKEKFIEKALASICSQNMLPKEIIIVNDGSTDSSEQEVAKFVETVKTTVRITLVNTGNFGVSAARNSGVELAKCKYVSFLDADDVWDKNYLTNINQLINDYPKAIVFSCSHKVQRENDKEFTPNNMLPNDFRGILKDFCHFSQKASLINSSKVTILKEKLIEVGGFPIDVKVGEDIFVWIRLEMLGAMAFINKPLVTINQFYDVQRTGRVGEIPYPIKYFASDSTGLKPSMKIYLKKLGITHVLMCLKDSNSKQALEIVAMLERILNKKLKLTKVVCKLPCWLFKFSYMLYMKLKQYR
jgi:glycosyltransferase involved in cell wall biosynthesis